VAADDGDVRVLVAPDGTSAQRIYVRSARAWTADLPLFNANSDYRPRSWFGISHNQNNH
jgi:hypothetical protein